jgi:hypothetical protein
MTERWHSGRTDWTSPAAALAGAGVIPGVALGAYQHRMAQFTTLSVDTPLPVGPPTPSGTSRGHPGRVRGPERKPGPTALRFLRGWAVVDRPRVTRGTIAKWQRFLRCGISTRTGGHVMAERDRGHRRGARQRGSHQHGPTAFAHGVEFLARQLPGFWNCGFCKAVRSWTLRQSWVSAWPTPRRCNAGLQFAA